MSLFNKLLRHKSAENCALEDFNTEIVAYILAQEPQFTLDWLRSLGITHVREAEVAVTTQVSLKAIEGIHERGSRPDMEIRLIGESIVEVIYLESKVGSKAAAGQLEKYRDHLEAQPCVDRRALIYITRDYDPKLDLSTDKVNFVQTRWSEFCNFIADNKLRNNLAAELIDFMKSNGMNQSKTFRSIDIVALTNHSHAISLMAATLDGRVEEKFKSVTGGGSSSKDRFLQIYEYNNYTVECYHPSKGRDEQICVVLGYWFPNEQPSDSPVLGVKIFVKLRAQAYVQIVNAMRHFAESSQRAGRAWKIGDNDQEWGVIECARKLERFLGAEDEDHVSAIGNWFVELLDDVQEFRNRNPALPWAQ